MNDARIFTEEEPIDWEKWFQKLLSNWILFASFLIISFILAFLYNWYALDEYSIRTKLLIKEEPNPLDKSNIVKVSLSSDPYRLENEIGILTSSSITKRTIQDLDFYVEYFQKKGFNAIELYHNSPIIANFDPYHVQLINCKIYWEPITDSTLLLEISGDSPVIYDYSALSAKGKLGKYELIDTLALGDTLENEYFKFSINASNNMPLSNYMEEGNYFIFRSLTYLATVYGKVSVSIPRGSSLIDLSLEHTNPQKASDYLNMLVSNYLRRGIERETRIAELTIDFIDGQLNTIVDSLQQSEQELQDFRSENQLVNLEHQAKQVYERQTRLEGQKAELQMQKRYLEYLVKNLESEAINAEEILSPSTMGIADPVLNSLVLQLVEQYHEYAELTLNTKKTNPYITSYEIKIESTKSKLKETVLNLLNANNITLDELSEQIELLEIQMSDIPKDQRALLRFQRSFDLNDELYTYLLTRRSEMQIKKASNLPVNEILEEANPEDARKIKPNKRVNYIIGLILGLSIPFGLVYLKVNLNQRIESIEDIKHITEIPVVGTIMEDENLKIPAVKFDPNSIVAESFRILRANMQFVLANTKSPVILISSAMKGEGKSYNAINIASVYASYGAKVCLVDLDLRRPRLAEYLKSDNEKGMSNCLVGQEKPENIKIHLKDINIDLYPSGPIPPNPSELVASEKLTGIINQLRSDYDYVILDSPPIGMVSDALLISRLTDFSLLVIRHNVTYRQLLQSLIEELSRNKIKGVNLIFNNLPGGKSGYYRYGYRYSYYKEEKPKSWFGKMIG